MNSGPIGSLTVSRRIRSISDLSARIEPPARHLIDRLQLAGMARAPKRGRDALIEHPADRQLNNMFAEAVLRQLIEPLHGGKILGEPRRLELRVGAAQIVTIECSIWPHPPRQQAPAERAIAERRDLVLATIGQDISLDLALEQIIGRLQHMQRRDASGIAPSGRPKSC